MKFLLVGLGGSGSKIVDRVSTIVSQSEKYRNKVQFVCMDTDDNDGKKLKNLTSVRTSSDLRIEAYLKQTEGWEAWFPDDPLLRLKSLKEGAGQIRSASRLALDSAITSNRMAPLKNAIDKLLQVDEDADTTIKVMVVCSLAGGTGSGIFLQIPNIIKKYLSTQDNQDIIIRGLFLMPDIFKDEVDDPVQKESVLANAYASFRELNAVNKACALPAGQDLGYSMAINDFSTERDQGDSKKIPYNLIFAIDKKNKNGQKITSIDRFEEQAVNIIMMQFFSPVVESQFSKEDNRYPSLIQTKGRNIYGTAGTAKLVYPYDDIMSYCATRSVIDSIDKKWMYFDQVYKTAEQNYEKERKTNPAAQKPDIQQTIIDNVDKELKSDESTIFSFMKRELLYAISDTDGSVNKVDEYYNGIYNYVVNLPALDQQLELLKVNSTIQPSQHKKLKDRDTARQTIAVIEENLKNYKIAVDNFVNGSIAFRAVNAIMWSDYDAKTFNDDGFKYYLDQFKLNEGAKYSFVNNVLMIDDQFISPISARYAVYQLLADIQKELTEAERDIKLWDSEIQEYRMIHDDLETPVIENAISVAREYENQGLIEKLLHGSDFKGFIDKYIALAAEQNDRITVYAERKMYVKVFKEVKARLMVLADEYTQLFGALPAVKSRLKNEAIRYAQANPDSELVKYILGDSSEKEAIYENIKMEYEASDSLNDTINRQINQSLYVEASKKIKEKNETISTFKKLAKREYTNDHLSKLFTNAVVDATRVDFVDKCHMSLDQDVGTLLYERYDDAETVKAELKKIANLAVPLLSFTAHDKQQMYDKDGKIGSLGVNYYTNTYWVMHPDTETAFKRNEDDLGSYFSVRGDETGRPDISVAEDFSPYELVCYNAVYGLEVNDIDLLNEETGECYLAYEKRISQLNTKGIPFGANYNEDNVIITPHLDLRWHNALPYISAGAEDKERYKKDCLLLYALAYKEIGLFNLEVDDKNKYYFNVRRGHVIEFENQPVREDYAFQLREAAYQDRTLVRALETTLTKAHSKDIASLPNVNKEKKVTDLMFVKGLAGLEKNQINICDFLSNYARSAPNNQTERYEAYLGTVTRVLKDICVEISEQKKEEIFAAIKNYWFDHSKLAEDKDCVEYSKTKIWIDMQWDEE